MTDTTNAPDPAAENVTLRTTLAALQADNARLLAESQTVARGATESQTALAAALRDRDALTVRVTALEPLAAERDALQLKVEGFTNEKRETALVDALRAKFPGADALAIGGVVAKLHEQGKINRFAEDPAAEVAKALPIITAEAPSLARPPTGAAGSSLVRPTTAAPAANVSLFRPTPK